MKPVKLPAIRQALQHLDEDQLSKIILRLARFKKDNKELLTYLLFDAEDEERFIEGVKTEIIASFQEINTSHNYYIRKSTRKILSRIKKYVRYSGKAQTEIELLICFCRELKDMQQLAYSGTRLNSVYEREKQRIHKLISGLHEDLQYDYNKELEIIGL